MLDDEPSPVGLLRCLRMLADEADAMKLTQTVAALQKAMETCRIEAVSHRRRGTQSLH